jgi:hypothetical protein
VLLYPSISLYLTAKSLTLEQWTTARRSQNSAFIACLALLLPAYSASAYPQLLVACLAGMASYPVMWVITRSLVPKKIKVPVDENQNLIKH